MPRFAVLGFLSLLAFTSTEARAQWLSIGAGPALGHGALADRYGTGMGAFVSLEQQRPAGGLVLRAEIAASGFRDAGEAGGGDQAGALRHVAALAHVLYALREREAAYLIQPYVGAGAGPSVRSVAGESSGIAALGAVSAGVRAGRGDRRALVELRSQVVVGGPSGGTRARAASSQLVLGVSL